MGIHIIDLPRKIVVGSGVIARVGEHLRELYPKGGGVLVVTGPNVRKVAYEELSQSLEGNGFSPWSKVVEEASLEVANAIAEEALQDKVEVIVGLGGGKSIDVAKFAAKVAGKAFVSVPTAASHDGISSPYASLKGFERPISKLAKPPDAIIVDIAIVSSAPRRYNAAGFGDLLGKFTAVRDWKLAHLLKGEYFGDYAASLALMSAEHVSSYHEEIAAGTPNGYRVLLEALVSSGVAMCIAGSTRPASGSEHLFAHALSMIAKNPPLHGEAVGVGTIIMAELHRLNWRRIRALLKAVGAPTNAKELGVKEEEVVEALMMAPTIRPERYTILGDKMLEERVARRLAERVEVI
ncbi:MAG: NAD(P)-dependent glycerol-1-phosphate dehydrogenase [Acidilobaceae archaeon]|nr:NAD(P)-dependent glycerol-1-phosphate dehydrogenase [Acidilobaceae archaeon]MDW7973872.1 NAD(P)-dependent glycerol-1-phosphate dehydrogenase [Sulfolobales archaeon]